MRSPVVMCAQLAASHPEKFRDVEWTASPGGAPILAGAIAWLDGVVDAEYAPGDHVIVVIRVQHLDLPGDEQHDSAPLVFLCGQYDQFQP